MDRKDLFKLYREIYFHEMDVKEKLVARTQISFAIVVTAITIISYMSRMLDFTSNTSAITIFMLLIVTSISLLLYSVWLLIQSFSWKDYRGISSPSDTDGYRLELIEYSNLLKEYNEENSEDQQELCDINETMETYLYNSFKECATHNTEVNDGRSGYARDGFKWILFSLCPLALAGSLFIIFDLDTSSPRKEFLIKDTNVATQLSLLTIELNKLKMELDQTRSDSSKIIKPETVSPIVYIIPNDITQNLFRNKGD